MARGPAPLPKNVREIRGSKKPPTAAQQEVDLPVSMPDVPDDLTDAERVEYERAAGVLSKMRVINAACRDALKLYARLTVEMDQAHQHVLDEGCIVVSPNGFGIVNPWLAVRRKNEDKILKLMQEFGFTPSSQTRIQQG